MNSIPTNQSSSSLSLHEIVSLDDPYYDNWLDIFQKSFPLSEQVLVSVLNQSLRKNASGVDRDEVYLVCLNQNGDVVGIVRTDYSSEFEAISIWYLAVDPDVRGAGIGCWLYNAMIEYAARDRKCRAVVFEVEMPDECADQESKSLAQRRIGFYRRQGAKLLGGVHYVQTVEWQPPIPMHIMVHPFENMTADEALILAEKVLDEDIHRIGEISLT